MAAFRAGSAGGQIRNFNVIAVGAEPLLMKVLFIRPVEGIDPANEKF
jgi:hypothetical protein